MNLHDRIWHSNTIFLLTVLITEDAQW
jgi:hypothetical protein